MKRSAKAALVLVVGLVANLLIACETIDLTFTVDSLADARDAAPGDGICRTAASVCTLRAAVDEANADPAKKVQANLTNGATYALTRSGVDDGNSVGDIDVTGDIRLVGTGSTIDAGGLDRGFDVAGYLRLTGITVRNGATSGDGGGIRVRSGSVDLHQSTVRSSVAGARGGGIAVVGGSVAVRTSTISSNGAGVSGGGIDVASGATASVTNSTVSGNRVDPAELGGFAGVLDPVNSGTATPVGVDAGSIDAGVSSGLAAPTAADGSVAVIVRFAAQGRAGIAQAREAVLGRSRGRGQSVRVNRTYEQLPFVAVNATPDEVERLRADPAVLGVQADSLDAPTLAQSIPRIRADHTAGLGIDGSGLSVAIIDTGVDSDEAMTAGKVVGEACFARGSDGALNGVGSCPSGGDTQTGVGSGRNCAWAGCFHGTHVASIAAGSPRSISGAVHQGVAPGASIVSVNVFSRFTDQASCGAGVTECVLSWTSDQLAALNWVYGQAGALDIAAVNMSLGGGGFASHCDGDVRKTPIDLLWNMGVPTVISSGNDGNKNGVGAPSCISTAVTVGATHDDSDQVAAFSQSSPVLDLLAPGVSIMAEYPTVPGDPNDYTATASGTSMAAPHVAGAFAVLRSTAPDASVASLLSALVGTGVATTDTNGVTRPRIDVRGAWERTTTIGLGGGIASRGTLGVVGSTVVGNRAWTGAGVHVGGTFFVSGSIVAQPLAGSNCGIVAGTNASTGGHNVFGDGSCFSGGTDLVTASTVVGALASNGGPTQTHLPVAGSVATNRIPVGTATLCTGDTLTDQRLIVRPQGGSCDSGAVET